MKGPLLTELLSGWVNSVRLKDLFGPIANKIALHARQNHELTQLRDWLLPLLMNGQVRVASRCAQREQDPWRQLYADSGIR